MFQPLYDVQCIVHACSTRGCNGSLYSYITSKVCVHAMLAKHFSAACPQHAAVLAAAMVTRVQSRVTLLLTCMLITLMPVFRC
jgi:hypothetical protein